jgi:hypothetical protein
MPAYIGNLGSMYNRQGRWKDGERAYREAVTLARRVLPEGAYEIGMLLKGHGTALRALGRWEAAEAALLESHELLRASRGEEFAGTQRVGEELVRLYEAWGRPERAAEVRTRARE